MVRSKILNVFFPPLVLQYIPCYYCTQAHWFETVIAIKMEKKKKRSLTGHISARKILKVEHLLINFQQRFNVTLPKATQSFYFVF